MHLGITKNFWKKIDVGVEELILGLIIVLNFLDGFEIISSEWNYIKKIISWSALGVLFYRADINKLFTGQSSKRINLLLVFGFLSLIVKNLVSYAIVAKQEAEFLLPFYQMVISYAGQIEIFSIYIGVILILFASFYFAIKQKIRSPSILYFLHSDYDKPKNIGQFFQRTLSFFIVSIIFYVAIFNLVMEWLAISIDAPLVIIGFFIYFFFILKHKKKFKINSLLAKIGDFGTQFYTKILEYLKYRRKFLFVLGGILSLHLLTDLLIFIWPYIFGVKDVLYFSLLGVNHGTIWQLLSQNIIAQNRLTQFFIILIYLFNILSIIFLLSLPSYVWWRIYKGKKILFSKRTQSLFFSSLILFLIFPLFKIVALSGKNLAGIDIQTSLISLSHFYTKFWIALVLIVLTLLVIWNWKKITNHVLKIIFQIFFLSYILKYIYSLTIGFFNLIELSYTFGNYFLIVFFIILFVATLIFYFVSLWGYEFAVIDEDWFEKKKKIKPIYK